jgi:hypothetical protein
MIWQQQIVHHYNSSLVQKNYVLSVFIKVNEGKTSSIGIIGEEKRKV